MWPALAAIVAALASLLLPILVFWYITSHFQQLQNALKQAFGYPGIAVGAVVTPLVLGGLVFFGGLVAVGVGGYVFEKHFAGEKARPPVIGPISAPSYPASQAVAAAGYAPFPYGGYTGQGFSVGAGTIGSRGRGSSSSGSSGRASRPRSTAAIRTSRAA